MVVVTNVCKFCALHQVVPPILKQARQLQATTTHFNYLHMWFELDLVPIHENKIIMSNLMGIPSSSLLLPNISFNQLRDGDGKLKEVETEITGP